MRRIVVLEIETIYSDRFWWSEIVLALEFGTVVRLHVFHEIVPRRKNYDSGTYDSSHDEEVSPSEWLMSSSSMMMNRRRGRMKVLN